MLLENNKWKKVDFSHQRKIVYESWIRNSPIRAKHNTTIKQSYKILNGVWNFTLN